MSVDLVPEDILRAALRPYRVDPDQFEAAVRERLKAAERQRADDPLAGLSPLRRSVAAFLPLPVIAGSKMAGTAAKLVPATGGYKLLSYVAFPAISLFVLLGGTVFSVAKIRSIREENGSGLDDEQAIREAIRQWWRRHKWGALLVYAATLALSWVGATWLLFLFYIISLGLLLYVLATFAKLGLGNRQVIALSCLMGLALLGQLAGFATIGVQDIHFVDQALVEAVFWAGAILLGVVLAHLAWTIGHRSRNAIQRVRMVGQLTGFALCAVMPAYLVASDMNSILWPMTPSRIKGYVESFDKAPFSSSSWQRWEIVASWVIESKLDPDLSGARRLLAEEIAGEQNPFVLGSAFRLGLVRTDQLGQLRDYDKNRHFLLDDPQRVLETRPITTLDQEDWVIRASVLRKDLSSKDRDYLEKRLHATLEDLSRSPNDGLKTALRVTQLLEVIGRPIDRDQYRDRVHDWLRKFHSKKGGGFEVAGGFKMYLNVPVGSLETTAHAVELMEVYGIPDDLDLNWVRSFLRPRKYSADKWIAAVTLDRLNRLPGVTHPTWLEIIYYERSLIAAAVLVGLCIYATLASPKPKASNSSDG